MLTDVVEVFHSMHGAFLMIRRDLDSANDGVVLSGVDMPARSITRGVVIVADHPRFIVDLANASAEGIVSADILATSTAPLPIAPGDAVLCWVNSNDPTHAVILGRIGPSKLETEQPQDLHDQEREEPPKKVPDTLIIEAKQSITLRVGDGSITIREDGKILIKGKDLVSHAQRVNRIKGGAVSIN